MDRIDLVFFDLTGGDKSYINPDHVKFLRPSGDETTIIHFSFEPNMAVVENIDTVRLKLIGRKGEAPPTDNLNNADLEAIGRTKVGSVRETIILE